MPISRRDIVVAGAAYLCGFPAMARASNATIETMLEEVRNILLVNPKDAPDIDETNRVTGDDLYRLVLGKSVYGTTNKGKVYVLAFQPEGKALLRLEDEPLEEGRWWISSDAHSIHSQWSIAADGEALNMYYRELGDGLFAGRTLEGRRYAFFFIGETQPALRSA
ncbi:MAG: hypothetical protein AAF699_16730 [Pseudomonadota bacterium]